MLKGTVKILKLIIAENRESSVQSTAVNKGFKYAEGTGPRVEREVDRNEEREKPLRVSKKVEFRQLQSTCFEVKDLIAGDFQPESTLNLGKRDRSSSIFRSGSYDPTRGWEDWITCLHPMHICSTGNSNSVRNDILGVSLGAQNYHFCIHICAHVCPWLTFVFNNSSNIIRPQVFTLTDDFLLVFEYYFYCRKKLNASYTVLWDSTYPHTTLSYSIFFLSSHPG